MTDFIFYALGEFLSAMALNLFFIKMFEKRYENASPKSKTLFIIIRCIAYFLFCVLSCVAYFNIDNKTIFFLVNILIYFVYSLAYSLRLEIRNIIATLVVVLFRVCSELVAALTVSFAARTLLGSLPINESIVTILLSRIILCILTLFVRRSIEFQNKEGYGKGYAYLALLFPLLSVLVFLYLFSLASLDRNKLLDPNSIGAFLSVLAIIAMNTIAFYTFDKLYQTKNMENEKLRLDQTILAQEAYFEKEAQARESIRKMRHDHKNMLIALHAELQDGNVKKALNIINNELGDIDKMQLPSSGNLVVDSIIAYKTGIAAEKTLI